MSTSRPCGRGDGGFSLVELLVGLALVLCVSLAALALWRSVESTGVSNGDRMLRIVQGRVALARLERDVRLATAQTCPFASAGCILEATKDQVVFLTRSNSTGELQLVEWELAGRNLMRRRGPCPNSLPSGFSHALYADNKTMLESVSESSRFRYFVRGNEVLPPVDGCALFEVDEIELAARTFAADRPDSGVDIIGGCLVGRR